jgi:serine/threonine protein kinase
MTLPGSYIGQYEIVEQIGTGGMATVFKAHHPRLDRDVAIKIMHSMFLTDSNFIARFEREARVVARLDHPNIVPVYDYELHNGQPYLVMKLVEGKTLKELVSKEALSLDGIMRVLPAIASALSYAHSQGVLHRDVKPSNVIIADDGTPYLTDFGLARIAKAGESTMSADMLLGTPYYISPEQAQGGVEIDARADVYSLGVMLYELVVGRLPFSGDTPYIIVHKHIYEAPTPPSQINPQIPAEVEFVLLKALAKNPDDRYLTANALSEAFAEAVQRSGLSALDANRTQLLNTQQAPVRPKEGSPLYKKDAQGNIVSIPAPVPSPDATPMQSLQSLASQDSLREIGNRFREAIGDIKNQIQDRELWQGVRSGAERAMVEISSKVEEAFEDNGEAVQIKVGSGTVIFSSDSKSARRQSKVIRREWGMDEASVRARVSERMGKWRGLLSHLVVYVVMSGVFIAMQPIFVEVIGTIFEDDPAFLSLRNLPFALTIILLWGGGLASHAIDTFYKTGSRLDERREKINQVMTRRYGENWTEVATDKEYKRVRNEVNKRTDQRASFFQHVASSIFVIGSVIAGWDVALGPMLTELLGDDVPVISDLLATNVPLLFSLLMLVGIAIHGITVFLSPVMGEEAQEREVERELERSLSRKAKRDDKLKNGSVRLTEDGEFTDSLVESLEDERRRGRG